MPTPDQIKAFASTKWARYVDNPPLMASELFGFEPTDYQADVMRLVAAGRDVTWRAGHGVGKTATLAMLVFWYLLTRPYSRVPTTAPTYRQVKDVLWSEIALWFARFPYREALRLDRTRLSVRGHESEWFAIGVASNRPQNLEGFHARHILFVGDEAKGIPDPIFDAIDGALTTGGQRLYTSTPGSRLGRFYESHFGRVSRFFARCHTNGETAQRVSRAWLDQKREEWGEDSPIYASKIRGEFPVEGDDVLIPVSYIDAAETAYELMRREGDDDSVEPLIPLGPRAVIGCDVARHGHNETVAAYGSVKRIEWIAAVPRGELYETAAWLRLRRAGWAYRWTDRKGSPFGPEHLTRAELIGVDDTGVGGGVTSDLRRESDPVLPIGFGEAASAAGRAMYANLKTEAAFMVRGLLAANARAVREGKTPTFAMVSHDRLRGQLSNLRTRPVSGSGLGRVRILDPDDPLVDASEIPKGLRVSPDHAHAVIFAVYAAQAASLAGAGVMVPPQATAGAGGMVAGPVVGRRRYAGTVFRRGLR